MEVFPWRTNCGESLVEDVVVSGGKHVQQYQQALFKTSRRTERLPGFSFLALPLARVSYPLCNHFSPPSPLHRGSHMAFSRSECRKMLRTSLAHSKCSVKVCYSCHTFVLTGNIAPGDADKTWLGSKPGQRTDVGGGKSLASKRRPKTTADSYRAAHRQHVSVIVWLLLGERQTDRQMGGAGMGNREEQRTNKGRE